MTDYFVVTPYDVYDRETFAKKMPQLAKEGRHVMAVVFDCKDIEDFERKFFREVKPNVLDLWEQ